MQAGRLVIETDLKKREQAFMRDIELNLGFYKESETDVMALIPLVDLLSKNQSENRA